MYLLRCILNNILDTPFHCVFEREKYCYDGTNKKIVVESCKFNTMQLLSVLGNSYIIPNTNQLYCEPW